MTVARIVIYLVLSAVNQPGVKWTLLALSREPFDGAATESM
jgi:hypothetical protein